MRELWKLWNMKKTFVAAALLAAGLSAAAQVNESELKSAQRGSVRFENYGGPHAVIDSAQAIMAIGTALGDEVAGDPSRARTVQPQAKYSLHHVIGAAEEDGLDADVLVLGDSAGVDHIDNLRRIVAGYLMAAYHYGREDAETIAVFVTVYNAVYRGDLQNFSGKYKSALMPYLREDSVGLSTNWEEWAGRTQIVIPLGELRGGELSVETSVISDEKVIEALRSEDGRGADVRESLAEMKEREAADAGERARAAQKEAAQERRVGNREAAAESARTAGEQQRVADRKGDEARAERETIARDREEARRAAAGREAERQSLVTGIFVADEGSRLYTLMTVNAASGEVVRRSTVRTIREKAVFPVSGVSVPDEGATVAEGFVAVCGVPDGKSAVRLCVIDAGTLSIRKQSSETLSEHSPLAQSGDVFYAIVSDGGKNYLASYDKDLSLKGRSSVAISGASPLALCDGGVLVTDERGSPALLSAADLEPVW